MIPLKTEIQAFYYVVAHCGHREAQYKTYGTTFVTDRSWFLTPWPTQASNSARILTAVQSRVGVYCATAQVLCALTSSLEIIRVKAPSSIHLLTLGVPVGFRRHTEESRLSSSVHSSSLSTGSHASSQRIMIVSPALNLARGFPGTGQYTPP